MIARKKIFILLYDDRSGSTYLASLLAKHPDVGVTIESLWLTNLMKYGDTICTSNELNDIVMMLYSEKKFRDWNINESELRNYLASLIYPAKISWVVNHILEMYFIKNYPNSSIWIIKQGSIYHINGFKKIFPNVKFIQIVRDGRAVYSSKKRSIDSVSGKAMQRDPIKSAMIWKKQVFTPLKKIKNTLDLHEVKYEDLILDYIGELNKIYIYLGVGSIDPLKMKAANANTAEYFCHIPDSQKHLHKNIGDNPIVDRIFAWKKNLSRSEIFVYELFAKKELIAKGYVPMSLTDPLPHNTNFWLNVFLLFAKSYLSRLIRKTLDVSRKFLFCIMHPAECGRKIKWRINEKF